MLIVILLLSHLIADFILQSYRMAEEKGNSYKTAVIHTIIHLAVAIVVFLATYIFTLDFGLLRLYNFFAVGLAALSHFLIDKFGKKLLSKLLNNNDFFIFIIDQILHVIFIFVIVFLLVPTYNFNHMYRSIFVENVSNRTIFLILCVSTLLIMLTSFTGHLIAKLFKSLNHKNNFDNIEEIFVTERKINELTEVITEKIKFPVVVNDYGKWIGYCERIIIFLLVIIQVYEGIAIIVALKTFARYQQLNQKSFVEKYLLGTLFSVMVAIIIGFLYKLM